MQQITSLRNPAVLAAKTLQTKKGRDESGLFLCEGEHMVSEALANAPEAVRVIFVQDDCAQRYAANAWVILSWPRRCRISGILRVSPAA